MANKRKCICCGKIYEYCPNCEKRNNNPWMVTFDCLLCKELFNEVSLYNVKRVTKEAVQDFVKRRGITDFSVYEAPIRKVLEETKVVAEEGTPDNNVHSVTPNNSLANKNIEKAAEDTFGSLLNRRKKKRYGY